ncbi:unnamed protein product, partial [Tilletia laevis]
MYRRQTRRQILAPAWARLPPPPPQTPTGSKRHAGEALSASPSIRKKVLGSLATKLGVQADEIQRALAEAEVEAVEGEAWSDIMGDEDDEAQAACLDRSNASILAEDIVFTARLAPRNRADEDVNMEDDNA